MDAITIKTTKQDQIEANKSIDSLQKFKKNKLLKSIVKIQVEGIEEVVEIPQKAFSLFKGILEHMSEGKNVSLIANDSELTTQEAADILSVSRPYLVRLLKQNKLPHIKVGTHRRLLLKDVLKHDKETKKKRRTALNELSQQAQELNLGY